MNENISQGDVEEEETTGSILTVKTIKIRGKDRHTPLETP